MPILLDDGEIWELVGEARTTYGEDLEIIAKAQLKAVAEWGGETCREHPGEYEECPKGQCSICWQDLLKEAGE